MPPATMVLVSAALVNSPITGDTGNVELATHGGAFDGAHRPLFGGVAFAVFVICEGAVGVDGGRDRVRRDGSRTGTLRACR